MPQAVWDSYFREVERLFRPGGLLQLYCSKDAKPPVVLSPAGLLARARWYAGKRGGPQLLTHSLIETLLPGSMTTVTLEDFPYRLNTGLLRDMTHGIFRKDPEGPAEERPVTAP